MTDRLESLGHPAALDRALADDPAALYAQWHGELDPATGQLLTPWPPGSADRLWYVLAQMADAHGGAAGGSDSAVRPGGVVAGGRVDTGA
ncbi:hypothetical protein [Streptomyces sp. NPDC007205]|uniref:hypothetical protein n=1 Tax=Streptomyces sp. NPDC007205 TaxID=3154316 RepID=UPI0033D88339